ncbi:MAG: SDR family NAD(P)-dependent oxidoreductase [Solirubrobacterales bacterium]
MPLPDPTPGTAALVTGASSGIGAELARGLARRGHAVVLVARRRGRLEALAEELSDEHGVATTVISADLADPGDRDAMVALIDEKGLEISILANNAGLGDFGPFAEADRERLLQMGRVNVEAVVDLTSRYLGPMVERGEGAVIMIASGAAHQPLPGFAAYAATKAHVLALSEALHAEASAAGVTVTAVCPGPVHTEFGKSAGVGDAESGVPEPLWTESDQIAEAALEGADAGDRVVNPGLGIGVAATAGRFVPRAVLLPLVRTATRRFS